jgi:hypothetical protein
VWQVSHVAEGILDRAVLLRLLKYSGMIEGKKVLFGGDQQWKDKPIVVKINGKLTQLEHRSGQGLVLEAVALFNAEAHRKRWVALIDLDNKFPCAGLARRHWLPSLAPYMCFRIAVQEVEGWLLADRERLATFLAVPLGSIPNNPETMTGPLPKEILLTLAQRGSRAGIVKGSGTTLQEGALYNSGLAEFVRKYWRPIIAAQNSPSLKRCIERLQQLSSGQPVN